VWVTRTEWKKRRRKGIVDGEAVILFAMDGGEWQIGHAMVRFGRSELTGARIKQKGMFDFVNENCE
jgi:hypothetical protein